MSRDFHSPHPDAVYEGVSMPGEGVPTLVGPFVIDYTDIPLHGNTATLWTPVVGDVLLRLFSDAAGSTAWDHGALLVGPNGDTTFAAASDGTDVAYDGPYVFGRADPVQVKLNNAGNSPEPGAGSTSLYALIARPTAP